LTDASVRNVPIRTGVTDAEWLPELIKVRVPILGLIDNVPLCGAVPPAESKNITKPLLTPFTP
jgi:hypothetical protein